jgi:hypothetical protein
MTRPRGHDGIVGQLRLLRAQLHGAEHRVDDLLVRRERLVAVAVLVHGRPVPEVAAAGGLSPVAVAAVLQRVRTERWDVAAIARDERRSRW